MINDSLGSIKLSRLKQIIGAAEAHNHDDIDMDITIEYLVGSCFPDLWDNFQQKIREQYTKGFSMGLAAKEGFNLYEPMEITTPYLGKAELIEIKAEDK